ncbi:But2 family protein [Schizosaccharomyces osmophilus]|uniref:But2 family protein n=1 Tax=Schizosaccharomyces osmophilus TaxID=2545709 RepID=A0AAE9W999_9SCHI|nr:But2 family protein [Schizosaccharomyces osmophilus]WBW72030.1 But2 family protein [Schizosaccharomyces osmophilus]
MKFSLSAVLLLTLFGIASLTLVSSISESAYSLNQTFSIMALHPYKQNVQLHPFTIGQFGYVYADSGVGSGSFTLKNSELFYNNEHASLDKNGALFFESSGFPVSGFEAKQISSVGYELHLNNTFPVACPITNTNEVYQIYYGKGNGNSDCIGVTIDAITS